jgi:aminoglycoside 3-N-acetyltransferase
LLCQHRAINLLIRCALARTPKMEERCVIKASPSLVFARLRRSCYRMDMLVPRSRLARDLEKLGLEPDGVTMVHCRMSALGYVVGGAETVVRALQDAVGPGGTLMAYTGWQDEPPDDLDALDEEARRIYIEEHPAYDPRVALSRRDHGRLPEALRTWPGACHSGHPEAGVAAVGPLAAMLVADHPSDDAYGAGTPYALLVELGGRVALLGAPLDTVTLVHHAEAVAEVPGKRRVSYGSPVIVRNPGERLWRTFSDIDTAEGALPYGRVLGEEDYIEHIVRSALAAGVGSSGPLGEATAYLLDARRLVEHAVAWIERNFASEELDGT